LAIEEVNHAPATFPARVFISQFSTVATGNQWRVSRRILRCSRPKWRRMWVTHILLRGNRHNCFWV